MKKIIIPLLCLLFASEILAQTNLSGTITDEYGTRLPSVTVQIKGTIEGVITDNDGNYSFATNLKKGTIVFSFLGLKTKEKMFEGNAKIDIALETDYFGLEEVVSIGYGTVKKRDLTGAVTHIKSDIIKSMPVANAAEALQGRVAGMDITRSSGKAGSSPAVVIRGHNSILAEGGPLYIIDGIEGSISSLNPNDIESIDVLKDISSTAIYGVEGVNGVVIITTKQAKKGKVQIDVDSYVGINKWESYPRALRGDDWLDYLEEKFYAARGVHSTSRDELLTANNLSPDELNQYIDGDNWIDWVDETLGTGIQQNYNINVRGGSEKTQGYFSLGYNSEKGIYKNDKVDNYTMRTGVTHQVTKWAKAGVQSTMLWQDRETRSSRINKTFGTIPLGKVYDADGNIISEPIEGNTSVSLLADDVPGVYTNNRKSIRATLNPFIELAPIKGLTINSTLGTTLSASRTGVFENENSYMKLIGSSAAVKTANYSTTLGYGYTWQNIATYKRTIAQDHNFSVTAIYNWSNSQSETSSMNNEGFNYDKFSFFNLGAGNNPSVSSGYSQGKSQSYACRLSYDYLGRYLLTLTNRWDGSSALAKKWDTFPSGSVAWRLSDEAFMDGTENWLTNLKLRAGYGIAGNAGVRAYSSVAGVESYASSLSLGDTQAPVYVLSKNINNRDLRWEKTYGYNLGIDIGLIKNKIDLTIDWYDHEAKDVLYNRPLPSTQGGYNAKTPYEMIANIARTNNRGIEISINTRNIDMNNFKWNTTFTFAKNKEKVKSIDLGSGTQDEDLVALNLFMGKPIDAIYGYKKLGIWQSDEADQAALYGRVPGQVKIETVEKFDDLGAGDGGVHTYSAADRQYLGSRTPDWSLGFQNNFYWKNFDLNIFTYMRWGQLIDADILGYNGALAMPETYDYWTETNPTNDYPRPSLMASSDDVALRSLSITDGSFLKIKNITLGYTLPAKLGRKFGIDKCRIYGTVTNPYIFSKSKLLTDVDPETGGSDSYPLYKQVVFGINLSF